MLYTFEKLEDFCDLLSGKRTIYLAAAGNYGRIVGEYLNYRDIVWQGYLDCNEQLHGTIINEKLVCSYYDIKFDDRCVIVICTIMRSKEIEDMLLRQGVNDENIVRLNNRLLFGWISYDLQHPEKQIRRLEALKDIGKKYKRCFVIGTGPSLTIEDLELLKEEFTFSVNSIVNCFHMTDWRPTCYVAQDPDARDEIEKYGVTKLTRECKYVLFAVKSGLLKYAGKMENIYYYNSMDVPYENLPSFSSDATDIVYETSTVIYSVLQLAYYMGFQEIYMLGIDLGFSCIRNSKGEIRRCGEKQATAEFLVSKTQQEPIYELDRIIKGYTAARQYAKDNRLILKNATRGGYLEELERVALEDVLKRRL
ncbi:MAG: DUF115 domain-containing protein [Lachnospiraceae bacterium]|nr:DUF115 domain-containing protein [Lachnospiraceae bacterium]